MSSQIKVAKFSKYFETEVKDPGLGAYLKSMFHRNPKILRAVDDINFDIQEGELVGFIGPNGAGKTTTLKTLSGLLYPTSGSVEVMGFDPYKKEAEFLKQITLVMGQKNQLWWDLPAIETFKLNKEIYGVPIASYNSILSDLVDLFDLSNVINTQVRKLSLGQRMKCELVAALLHTPKVIFLDEPTIGLDIVMQKNIRKFILDYNRKFNSTVMLTSHYMDDVKEICNRVIIINGGKLVYDGSVNDLIKYYADYKLLIPVFNSAVQKRDLEKFGNTIEFSSNKVVIKVNRNKIADTAAMLLSNFDIDDIDINEPKLEDVVAEIFSKAQTIV